MVLILWIIFNALMTENVSLHDIWMTDNSNDPQVLTISLFTCVNLAACKCVSVLPADVMCFVSRHYIAPVHNHIW